MLERLLIVLGAILATALLCGIWRLWQRRHLQKLRTVMAPVHLPPDVAGGKPTVLYFSTSECVQCRLQQAPILTQLQSRLDVAVHHIDALEQQSLANFYGIMTVPTTVVLDSELRPVAINHGVTPLQTLQNQIVSSHKS